MLTEKEDYCPIHGKEFDEECADCVHIIRKNWSRDEKKLSDGEVSSLQEQIEDWVLLEHPLLVGRYFEKAVKMYKAQEKKVLVDMMIADVPHINSKICEVLSKLGVDGVTCLNIGGLDKMNSHGLVLFVVEKEVIGHVR